METFFPSREFRAFGLFSTLATARAVGATLFGASREREALCSTFCVSSGWPEARSMQESSRSLALVKLRDRPLRLGSAPSALGCTLRMPVPAQAGVMMICGLSLGLSGGGVNTRLTGGTTGCAKATQLITQITLPKRTCERQEEADENGVVGLCRDRRDSLGCLGKVGPHRAHRRRGNHATRCSRGGMGRRCRCLRVEINWCNGTSLSFQAGSSTGPLFHIIQSTHPKPTGLPVVTKLRPGRFDNRRALHSKW